MNTKILQPKRIIIQSLILSILYFGLTEILIREKVLNIDQEIKRSLLYKKSTVMNTAWGDSQMRNAFGSIKDFINLSSGSQSYQEILPKIKKYYSRNRGEGTVILQASINSFAKYRDIPIRSLHKDYFLGDKLFLNLNISSKYFQERALEYWINFLKNKFNLVDLSPDTYREDGSVFNNIIYENYTNLEKKLNLQNIFELYDPGNSYKKRKSYDAFIKLISYFEKNRNLELCLVSLPWHPDLNKIMMKSETSKDIKNLFLDLSKSKNFTYIDFQEEDIPLIYFSSDSAHLNKNGSEYISKKIIESCNAKK